MNCCNSEDVCEMCGEGSVVHKMANPYNPNGQKYNVCVECLKPWVDWWDDYEEEEEPLSQWEAYED